MSDPKTDPKLIDQQIASLLRERFQRAMIIGVAKAALGAPIQNEEQEDRVTARALEVNRGLPQPLPEQHVGAIIREIMACAVDAQKEIHERWPKEGLGDEAASASTGVLAEQRAHIATLNDQLIRLIHSRVSGASAAAAPSPPDDLWSAYIGRIIRVIYQWQPKDGGAVS